MRLGPLSDWQPAPGRIVVLKPAADPVSKPLPGQPSFLQSDHLGAYVAVRAAGGTSRAWTGTVTELDGPLDEGALIRALGAFVARHEGLRTWFDLGPEPGRMAVDPPAFEAVEVDAPTDWARGWERTFVELYDAACTPDSWPGFLLGAIVRDDSWSMFWGCDHAFTDGASQLMAPVELSLLYEHETGGPAPELLAAAGFPAYADEERVRAAAYTAEASEIGLWREVVTRHGGRMPRLPLDLGLTPGETAPEAIIRHDLLLGGDVGALEALCREAGGRFTSGVFAALGLADRALGGGERYWGVTVLGTRDTTTLASHGWFCNFAPVEFELGPTLVATVPAAEHAMAVARAAGAMPVHAGLAVLLAEGATTPEQLYNPHMVSYLDLRRFPGADLPAYRNALHFTGEGRTANSALWINRDDDALYVCVRVPDTERGHEVAATYAGTVSSVLARAVAEYRGGLVGSDM